MKKNTSSNQNKSFNSNENDDDIDIKEIVSSLIRNKYLVVTITSIFTAIGFTSALTRKPVWEGNFQIVIKDKSSAGAGSSSLANQLTNVSSFTLGGGTSKTVLQTEIRILESPYVLKPVYDFVKLEKKNRGYDTTNWTFYGWRSGSLNIELLTDSTVLNLSYRDTDKSLILPVIDKISQTYQKYSGSDRERGIAQGINYLEDQIFDLDIKSKNSLADLQAFSLEHGLGNEDGLPVLDPSLSQQNLNNLDQFLANKFPFKINQFSNFDTLGKSTQTMNRYSDQFERLSKLESTLAEKSALLKPNSKIIRSLKSQIESLKSSLSRPKEILLKYRELKNTALRDEQSLATLQSNLGQLKLEQARQTDPWELISNPTLLDYPVAPKKKRLVIIYFSLGLLFSGISSIVKDKISGRIYKIDDLKEKIPFKLLKTLPSNKTAMWGDSVNLLLSQFEDIKDNDGIAVIPIGSLIDDDRTLVFTKSLKESIKNIDLKISNNLNEVKGCSYKILLFSPGCCTYNQLSYILEDCESQQKSIIGWILFDPDLNI